MPAKQKVSDDQIASLIRKGLTSAEIIKQLEYKSFGTSARIAQIAEQKGLQLRKSPNGAKTEQTLRLEADFQKKLYHNARKHINVTNGVVLVGSDAHYYPHIISTAHRAFVKFAEELRPEAVILNGDAFDGGTISRFPRIGWDSKPSVLDELKACDERMGEIEAAARTKKLFWPLGNHDARFETFLASKVPEFQGVDGFHLKDRFPAWTPCWSVWVNDDVVIKHRMRGGANAPRANTLYAGKSTVTGHLHALNATRFSDYNGPRYGVDTGTMADPYGPQFVDYTEDGVCDWASGFAVLTFCDGRLLFPELVMVNGPNSVEFRGQVIRV
jgi:hypothetical protein